MVGLQRLHLVKNRRVLGQIEDMRCGLGLRTEGLALVLKSFRILMRRSAYLKLRLDFGGFLSCWLWFPLLCIIIGKGIINIEEI